MAACIILFTSSAVTFIGSGCSESSVLRKNGAALINFVDGRVTDGFILREGEFVTSLQALKEIGIKAGFSAFAEE
ncbi:hypothetical protein CJV95_003981 [Escherichia coli]|nr:hypothetical protein [Escherichia coli]EFL5861328.1 hypothetical protein [Escherichia coli]